MPPVVRQQALTVCLPVRADKAAGLGAWLETQRDAVRRKLERVTSLHFGRFVVVPGVDARGSEEARKPLLVFESNFSGELELHVEELWRELGAELDALFGYVEGWRAAGGPGEFAAILRRGQVRASAYYVGCPGLSVDRIRADARLRRSLVQILAAERAAYDAERPESIVRKARAELERLARDGGCRLEQVERPVPPAQGGFWSVARSHALELVVAVLGALVCEVADFLRQLWHGAPESPPDAAERLDRIGRDEGNAPQNALTHVALVKSGRFRRWALRLALRIADELAERAVPKPPLAGFDAVHFARWVLLDDGRLLFFGDYDGSSEAALGDMVERASALFTLVGSNTANFPQSFGLFLLGGARDEERFKAWVRAGRLPTQIAYGAYPTLGVREVLANAEIREILASELDARGAARLLELA